MEDWAGSDDDVDDPVDEDRNDDGARPSISSANCIKISRWRGVNDLSACIRIGPRAKSSHDVPGQLYCK